MIIEREKVRALVREELVKRIPHPALQMIHTRDDDANGLEAEGPRPCVIEPERPCYQSGYCKRLGY